MTVRRSRAAAALALALWLGGATAGCGAGNQDSAYKERFDGVQRDIEAEGRERRLPGDFAGLTAEDVFAAPSAERGGVLRAQSSMGFGLIRQTFDWSQIERRRGRYTFRVHDAFVLDAARARIRILPILFRAPPFRARPADGRATPPPEDPAAMGRFAARLVRRYGPGGTLWQRHPEVRPLPIRSWQVWNEPNVGAYWGGRPDARGYASLVATVASALRRADPEAEIVSAGLPDSRLGIPFARYLRDLIRAGGGRSIDTFAIHPYSRTSRGLVRAVRDARTRLRRLEQGDKPIWVTEMGWASGGPESPFTVGAARQARYVRESIAALAERREADGIRGFVYFNWRDAPPYMGGRDFWGLHTGLLTIDGRRKPAFDALRGALLRAEAR